MKQQWWSSLFHFYVTWVCYHYWTSKCLIVAFPHFPSSRQGFFMVLHKSCTKWIRSSFLNNLKGKKTLTWSSLNALQKVTLREGWSALQSCILRSPLMSGWWQALQLGPKKSTSFEKPIPSGQNSSKLKTWLPRKLNHTNQSEAKAGINGILMRSIMKSYPQTDHFSMVPIKGDLWVPCLRFCKSFPVDAYRAFGNKEEFIVLPSMGP